MSLKIEAARSELTRIQNAQPSPSPIFQASRERRIAELVALLADAPAEESAAPATDDGSWDRYCRTVRDDVNAERRLEYRNKRR